MAELGNVPVGSEPPSEHLQWPMFVTAVAPNKLVNRALLLIQGFERNEHLSDSKWTLFVCRDLPSTTPPPTSSPLLENFPNDFAGWSHKKINAFMNAHWMHLDEMGFTFELWMILDPTGLQTDTCVICKHPYNGGDDDDPATWGYSDEFEALRVPLDHACAVYASLLYKGKEFEDYRRREKWEDGSWQFDIGYNSPTLKDSPVVERAEKAWQVWRNQGFID
ncbi:hypothetical protein K438DRAFT_1717621 [Mycena galopus ATCC 62051]|nr:hypothetical protein K438DRAFT_1717621 [Mycena galopus ATCC 62051]